MPNRENILALADFIESSSHSFDMCSCFVIPDYNIGGCVGAHAVIL